MEFNIDRVAFSIFGIDIMWYAILIVTGIICGLKVAEINSKFRGIDKEQVSNLLLYALPASIIGARIYYVAFEWQNYKGNFLSMINIREGGLAIHGAVIASILVVFFFSKYNKIDFRDLADICSPGLILGQAIGRWGNFINQEAHGGETTLPWGIIIEGKKYHPTFLYESLGNLIIFIFLMVYLRKYQKKKGEVFLLYLILYGILRFFVEGLRTDSLMFFGLRIAQIVSIISVVVGIGLFILNRKKGTDAVNMK